MIRFLFILLLFGCSEKKPQFLGEEAINTDSGLEYIVLNKGDGQSAVAGNEVLAHCTLKVGDSSVIWDTRGAEPFKFVYSYTSLIPGFDEIIGLMNQGDRYKVIIPPHLGYGSNAFGDVPANAYLSFDIELLEINDIMLWISDSLFNTWLSEGSEKALADYQSMESNPRYHLHERQLMILGSKLKNDGRLNDWFEVTKLRAQKYPESFSALFALGSAHEDRGERKLAITAYKKCLVISPQNPAAQSKLLSLE